jgi:hypothetical protein
VWKRIVLLLLWRLSSKAVAAFSSTAHATQVSGDYTLILVDESCWSAAANMTKTTTTTTTTQNEKKKKSWWKTENKKIG